ncbi:hypothetical protein CHS0354_012082 [Potamilus streckersoni]|uniref:Heat shock 70 kDa protein n=1 Tax=Potamilus streckersoni TaxID=2493646 RepID=A0AAE0S9X9_9BIVA|nr:hypothetical protein CHS0354_012082 [Potamilus streckersoni]
MRSARETGRAARSTLRSEQETASSTPTKLIVAAIDFGTTYSGYAYSFFSDFKKDSLNIYANTTWNPGGGEGLVTDKTPTSILFKPDGDFHSFGYDAENKYVELAEEDEHKNWHYFSRFKMKLHGQAKIRREMKLKDDQGHQMPAMKVFSEAIKYIKTHLLKSLREKVPDTRDTDIHWVITVPAIWDDGAKQFMREAGNEAGIPDNQLDLALEPEAAAIYCKAISVKLDGSSFEPGTQFILVDLGGGTADITIHKVGETGNLTELSPPSGGPWGGTKVDAAFDNLLEDLYGKHVIDSFIQDRKSDELDLKREFELKKRKFTGEDRIIFRGMKALTETLKENGRTLEQKLKGTIYEGHVIQKRDKLHIPGTFMSYLFEDVKKNIIQHMREVLMQHPKVNIVLMVGGFSESDVIKKAVYEAFPHKTVIIPQDARLAVVKGAVMYGHDTSVIISRSMPFTYGISVAVPFDVNKHPESKKVYKGGNYKCEDNFKVFIRAGETVTPGKTTVQHVCNASTMSSANVEIYRTKSKYPIYTDEPGCANIGSIQLQLNNIRSSGLRTIQITMSFGSTELSVQAKEEGTNNAVMAKFNFLH